MIQFQTYSGRQIDLENPRPEDIYVEDIVQGLSHCCRFAGQIPRFYSVAQHSCLVATLVDAPLRLAALLHDASEAYLGDLSRNVKHSAYLDGYRVLERKLQQAVQLRFAYLTDRDDLELIKRADDAAALFERIALREGRVPDQKDIQRLLDEGFVRDSLKEIQPFIDRWPKKISTFKASLDPLDPFYPWDDHASNERFSILLDLTIKRAAYDAKRTV